MAVYEIPLLPMQQSMTVNLPSGTYGLNTFYDDVPMGGWHFDLLDANGNSLACGVPMVTGCNLLGQLAWLGVGTNLYVSTDGNNLAIPGYGDLGVNSHLLFEF